MGIGAQDLSVPSALGDSMVACLVVVAVEKKLAPPELLVS